MRTLFELDTEALEPVFIHPTHDRMVVRAHAADEFTLNLYKVSALGQDTLIEAIPSAGNEVVLNLTNLSGKAILVEKLLHGTATHTVKADLAVLVSEFEALKVIPAADATVYAYAD